MQEEEVLEQRFFDLDALPENISPHQVEVIQMLVEKYRGEVSLARGATNEV